MKPVFPFLFCFYLTACFCSCASYKYYDYNSLAPENYSIKMSVTKSNKVIFFKEINTDSVYIYEDSIKVPLDSSSSAEPVNIEVTCSWQSAKPIYKIYYVFDNWQGEIIFNNRETGASEVKDKIYISTKEIQKEGKEIILSSKPKYYIKLGIGI